MKLLYILKQDADATLEKIIEEQKKECDITVIDLRENKDYEKIIEQIESSDKVISW